MNFCLFFLFLFYNKCNASSLSKWKILTKRIKKNLNCKQTHHSDNHHQHQYISCQFYTDTHIKWASQVVLVVKNPSANAGDVRDVGSIPRLGRSPGGGHGTQLQYSCLENLMDREAWWLRNRTHGHRSPKGCKELNMTEVTSMYTLSRIEVRQQRVCLFDFLFIIVWAVLHSEKPYLILCL